MEKLRGIVYVSRAIGEFDTESLEKLANESAKANQKIDVTGYLYYEDDLFLQYIEGEKGTVQSLMDHISRDTRHEVVNVITSDDLPDRYFPSWHMHYLPKSALIQVNMEEIIIDYINKLTKAGLEKVDVSRINVWNLINKLSKMRLRLREMY